jgi:hypothetical protein
VRAAGVLCAAPPAAPTIATTATTHPGRAFVKQHPVQHRQQTTVQATVTACFLGLAIDRPTAQTTEHAQRHLRLACCKADCVYANVAGAVTPQRVWDSRGCARADYKSADTEGQQQTALIVVQVGFSVAALTHLLSFTPVGSSWTQSANSKV